MDIENFIAEFKKTFVYDMLKDYVTDEKLFDHFVTENGDIVFLKEQTRQMWSMWQAAKAIPDGFVLVPKSEIGHYYYDENEGVYIDEPDCFLSDIDTGDVQEVMRRDYFDLPSMFATKVWDDESNEVGCWEFFKTEEDAEKAASYCKAMIEAQEKK